MRPSVDLALDDLTARSALRSLWFAGAIIGIPAALSPQSARYYLSLSGAVLAAAAIMTASRSLMTPKGLVRVAMGLGILVVGFASVVTGGPASPAFHSYAVFLVGGSWLVLSPAGAALTSTAIVAGGALMTWSALAGWLPAPWVAHTPWSRWLTTSLACALIAAVQWLEVNRLRLAFSAVREELARSEAATLHAARSEQRYAEVVSTIPGVVFEFERRPDGSRAFTFVSEGARRVFGVAPEAAIRDPEALFSLIQPTDRATVEALIARSADTLDVWELTGSIVTPSGQMKWLQGQAIPSRLPTGVVRWHGNITDNTARVEAERALGDSRTALKESLSLLQAALESTADGLLIVDRQGRVTGYNQKFLSMWRVPPALVHEGANEGLLAHVRDQLSDPEGFMARVREVNAHPDAATFDTLEFRDGRRFERYTQPQVVDGATVGRVASFRDVTARVLEERRRVELEQQLQHAQKMEALGTLAGGIAHDFNNLLTVVIGQADLARTQEDEAIRNRSLDEIMLAGERASDLVRRIREFSQPRPTERTVLAVASSVESTLQLLRSTLPKGIELHTRLCPQVTMFANATELQQVVTNLVLNARQAIGDGPGRIDVTLDEVTAAEVPASTPAPFADRYARFTVADTGRGMSADIVPRIFEPFFTTKAGQGSGLGLAVVHGIVRRHRAAVTVSSAPGAGATFSVFWPALAPSGAAAAPPRAPVTVPASGDGRHVLVVDDEPGVISVVVDSLKRIGYQVTAFTDPRDALARFRAAPDTFDAVLTDLSMPHLTGLELARSLFDTRPDIPVVLFTGNNADLGPEEVRAIGFRALLNKPMTPAALAEVLHRALEERGGTRPA